jgi:hypothetical protein
MVLLVAVVEVSVMEDHRNNEMPQN